MTKIDGRKLDHVSSTHLRKLAVPRVREGGEKPNEVMRSLGMCRTAIYPWMRAYDAKGMAVLSSHTTLSPKPKLTERKAQQVRLWATGDDRRPAGPAGQPEAH